MAGRISENTPSTGEEVAVLSLDRAEAIELPRVPPSGPFFYLAHPNAWTVLRTKTGCVVAPELLRFEIEPGVNRTDRHGHFHGALAEMKERGYTVIPHDVQGRGTSYMRKRRCRTDEAAGYIHYPQWAKYHAGSNAVTVDLDGYAAFCELLVLQGVVADVPLHVLERMRSEWQSKFDLLSDRARDKSSLSHEAKIVKEGLDAINRRIEEVMARGDDSQAQPFALPITEEEPDEKPAPKRKAQ
jgi:hypothetical protein